MSTQIKNDFELSRSMDSYIAFAVITGSIELLFVVLSIIHPEHNEGTWPAFVVPAASWLFIFWFGTRYRIWVKDGVITRRTADFKKCSIPISEISKVVRETSNSAQLARMNRPMQRITIYGKNPKKDHFDVSLKHFKREGIRRLMGLIHKERPDLDIPKGWI